MSQKTIIYWLQYNKQNINIDSEKFENDEFNYFIEK